MSPKKRTDITKEAIEFATKNGCATDHEIAKYLGCSHGLIRKKKEEFGLTSISFAEKYPDLVNTFDFIANEGITPYDFTYAESSSKYWWKTPQSGDHPADDHKWKATPNQRRYSSCAVCAGKHVVYSNSLAGVAKVKRENNPNDFAVIAYEEWDVNKNKPHIPETVLPYSNKKFWFTCKKDGHSFESILNNRVSKGRGCNKCKGTGPKQDDVPYDQSLEYSYPEIASLFIELTDSSDHRTAKEIRANSNKLARFRCDKRENRDDVNHFHTSIINNKVKGRICGVCANRVITKANSLASWLDKPDNSWFQLEWSDTNYKRPEDVIYSSHYEAEWICLLGHKTKSRVYKKTVNRHRCEVCVPTASSRGEIYVKFELIHFFKDIDPDRKGMREQFADISPNDDHLFGSLDIFIPSINIAVEFDPYFTHKDDSKKQEQKERDIRKINYWDDKGVKVIRMREIPLKKLGENDIVFPNKYYNGDPMKLKPAIEMLLKHIENVANIKIKMLKRYLESDTFVNSVKAELFYNIYVLERRNANIENYDPIKIDKHLKDLKKLYDKAGSNKL